MITTDTKFFTNDEGLTLLDRFKSTLKDARFFDVLVDFFRISGFYQLVDSFDNIEKTRILVGYLKREVILSEYFSNNTQ